jgi:enterochelin esterase-like enzyme
MPRPLWIPTVLVVLACTGSLRADSVGAGAKPPEVALENTETRSIASKIVGRTYGLLIALPDGYADSAKSYPVLYVLDGWHFPLVGVSRFGKRLHEENAGAHRRHAGPRRDKP